MMNRRDIAIVDLATGRKRSSPGMGTDDANPAYSPTAALPTRTTRTLVQRPGLLNVLDRRTGARARSRRNSTGS